MFVGSEGRLGVEEACQHCCLSTHTIIGLLQWGWEQSGWARISMGAESGQLGVSGGTRRGLACVFMCRPERETQKKAEKEKFGACTDAAQPFSPLHLFLLLSRPFVVYSVWCKQGMTSSGVRGLQVEK